MPRFTFIAETSNGATLVEDGVIAATHKEAYHLFWNGLTDAQRDACACIECVDLLEDATA